MYTLYWDRGSAAMAPHAVLLEIGAPFKLMRVDTSKGDQSTEAYLRLNPNARVPTLLHGDRTIYEAAAIVLYLCENHATADLMPPPGDPDRPAFLQWLIYFTNTIQEDLMHWWHADHYVDSQAARQELKAVAERRLAAMFQRLDAELGAKGPHILGRRFSVVDLYIVMLARWTRMMPKKAAGFPNLKRLIDIVSARPAWQKMMAQQGITWDGTIASET